MRYFYNEPATNPDRPHHACFKIVTCCDLTPVMKYILILALFFLASPVVAQTGDGINKPKLTEPQCRHNWKKLKPFLYSEDRIELDKALNAIPDEERTWDIWIVYGIRMFDYGEKDLAARVLGPRIPIDNDQKKCLPFRPSAEDGDQLSWQEVQDFFELDRYYSIIFEMAVRSKQAYRVVYLKKYVKGYEGYRILNPREGIEVKSDYLMTWCRDKKNKMDVLATIRLLDDSTAKNNFLNKDAPYHSCYENHWGQKRS